MFAYATGDGANSLVVNTYFSFTVLYYTKALGLDPVLAGLAISIATFWDAITDPIMGHITDNTRSRYGRRHPYLVLGGVLMIFCFYAAWNVPAAFQEPRILFWYLIVMNLLLRTASTIFGVPYFALGFEMCTDYTQRATLQGIRNGLNMVVNLGGPALLGWGVFLRSRGNLDGSAIPENYERMSQVFSAIALLFLSYMLWSTRKYATDSRDLPKVGGRGLLQVFRNLWSVLSDPLALAVFFFIAVLFLANVMVTMLQMFVYVDYMRFADWQKSVVHGGTMVGAAIGALISGTLVRLFDKKLAVMVAVMLSCAGNGTLLLLFSTGFVSPSYAWGAVPVAMLLFLLFHPMYHTGVSAAQTIAYSMMADVSEVNHARTGLLKDGSYSAMLTFVLKLAISVGALLTGILLNLIGYVPDSHSHAPKVLSNLFLLAFLCGTGILLWSLSYIALYPVNRRFMEQIRAEKQ